MDWFNWCSVLWNSENQIKAAEAMHWRAEGSISCRRRCQAEAFAQPVMKAFSPNSRHNGNNKSFTHTHVSQSHVHVCVCRGERFSIQRFRLQHMPRKRLISCGAFCQPRHPPTHSDLQSETSIVPHRKVCETCAVGSPVVRCLIKVGL
jgi:hypothetical protein